MFCETRSSSAGERYEGVKRNMKDMIINNFIGGIAWALGATVGLSIIFAIFGIIVKNINLVPVVGNFASQIITFVLQNNPHLVK